MSRTLDVPVIVIGRRLPRPGSLLSAGVVVRAADKSHPVLEILRDVVNGTVIDLEARLQERLRLPARAVFPSTEEAQNELRGLLDEEGAALRLDAPAVRGDRLALDIVVDGTVVTQVHAIVKRLQLDAQSTSCVVTALDDRARGAVMAFCAGADGRSGSVARRA